MQEPDNLSPVALRTEVVKNIDLPGPQIAQRASDALGRRVTTPEVYRSINNMVATFENLGLVSSEIGEGIRFTYGASIPRRRLDDFAVSDDEIKRGAPKRNKPQ